MRTFQHLNSHCEWARPAWLLFVTGVALVAPFVSLSQNPSQQDVPQDTREILGEFQLRVLSSPRGNYVELVTDSLAAVAMGETYVIERARLLPETTVDDLNFKRVATVTPPKNAADITRYLDATQAQEYAEALELSDVDALATWMNSNRNPEAYGIFYELSEVRQATGHLWLDDAANSREVFLYRVRQGRRGPVLGSGVGRAGVGNVDLLAMRPRTLAPRMLDSATVFNWHLAPGDSVFLEAPIEADYFDETAPWAVDLATYHASLRGRVFVQEDRRLRSVDLVIGSLGSAGDTLVFTHRYQANPGAKLYAYLVLEDFVYNAGLPSDTAYAFQRTLEDAELVYWIDSRDTTDGVAITWSPLTARPELAGVTIVRVGAEDKRDTLGTFSPDEQPFIDRDLNIGVHYIYEASATFLPGTGLSQHLPATTTGTYAAFERPLPPHGLVVEPSGDHIQLTWEEAPNASRFGYRVFRGTRPDRLHFAAGPIQATNYVDTAAFLSGRSTYYYAVQSVNLRQDTSVYSKVMSARPNRATNVPAPISINYYFANEALVVSWDEVRQRDNTVRGYRLERQSTPEQAFEPIGPEVLAEAEYRDTTRANFSAGVSYRVASVSVFEELSPYSPAFLVKFDELNVQANTALQNIFYLQALTGGIAVSWPLAESIDRTAYQIYRREVGSVTDFSLIYTAPIASGYYLDKSVPAPGLYEYTLKVIDGAGVAGNFGTKRTIRKP